MSDPSLADDVLCRSSSRLGELLLARNLTVATAESCTGGWIAKTLTDIPGSSSWFGFGLVSYSNQAKQDLLGVQSASLERHGAVSEVVVREMAIGALRSAQADLAISVSGIAGPDGGSDTKPVGTVWFGLALAGRDQHDTPELRTELQVFSGDRDEVRRATVRHALAMLLNVLEIS